MWYERLDSQPAPRFRILWVCMFAFILGGLLVRYGARSLATIRVDKEILFSSAGAVCLNPAVTSEQVQTAHVYLEEQELPGWKLVQVTVLQRHSDRWIYRHDNIHNVCWPYQLNSSDPALFQECRAGARSSVWKKAHPPHDPYAWPLKGNCNPKQITLSGEKHARQLGRILAREYGSAGRRPLQGLASCSDGSVFLAADAVLKNELTAEFVYEGLCGKLPSRHKFPKHKVGVTKKVKKKRPFWLRAGLCQGAELDDLTREAAASMQASKWWNGEVKDVAVKLANLSKHAPPEPADYRHFLHAMIDCIIVHSCIGLPDVPPKFTISDEHSLYGRADRADTLSAVWPLMYFKMHNRSAFMKYAQLQHGSYFLALLDRMQAVVDAIQADRTPKVPAIFIQVMRDVDLLAQLVMLGLDDEARVRPPYLSTLITELWANASGSQAGFGVRVVYNGRVQHPCKGQQSMLCPWQEFRGIIRQYIPDRSSCQILFKKYHFLSSLDLA